MAWCHQASSHYQNQCWPSFMLPYGVTRPQWVKRGLIQNITTLRHRLHNKHYNKQLLSPFPCICIYDFVNKVWLNSLRPGDVYTSVNWVITGSGIGLFGPYGAVDNKSALFQVIIYYLNQWWHSSLMPRPQWVKHDIIFNTLNYSYIRVHFLQNTYMRHHAVCPKGMM